MLNTLALMATLTACALLGACAAPDAPNAPAAPITQVCRNQDAPTGSNIVQRKKRECEDIADASREQAR